MNLQKQWKWNARKELAAQLLAQGELTHTQICQQLQIAPATLYRWQDSPEFDERVEKIFHLLRQSLYQKSLAIARARAEWRERFLERVIGAIDDMTVEEWRTTKKRPIAAITLALRLQAGVDAHNKQKEIDEAKYGLKAPLDSEEQAEYDASLIPFWDLAAETAQRIGAQREARRSVAPSNGQADLTLDTQNSTPIRRPEPQPPTSPPNGQDLILNTQNSTSIRPPQPQPPFAPSNGQADLTLDTQNSTPIQQPEPQLPTEELLEVACLELVEGAHPQHAPSHEPVKVAERQRAGS